MLFTPDSKVVYATNYTEDSNILVICDTVMIFYLTVFFKLFFIYICLYQTFGGFGVLGGFVGLARKVLGAFVVYTFWQSGWQVFIHSVFAFDHWEQNLALQNWFLSTHWTFTEELTRLESWEFWLLTDTYDWELPEHALNS